MPRTILPKQGWRVYIIYGFSEGPRLAKKLRKELAKRGGTLVKNRYDADIIITHSGGCFFLPPKLPGKRVLIANPVCGPVRRLPIVILQKIWWDFVFYLKEWHFLAWLRKSLWNLWYMASRPDRNIRMMRKASYFAKHLPEVTAKKVIVLNNQHDPWAACVPTKEIETHGYTYLTYPGPHDDIWINPAKYLDILQ